MTLDSVPPGGYSAPSRAQVAQLVEQRTENPRVGGSNPPLGTTFSQVPDEHRRRPARLVMSHWRAWRVLYPRVAVMRRQRMDSNLRARPRRKSRPCAEKGRGG